MDGSSGSRNMDEQESKRASKNTLGLFSYSSSNFFLIYLHEVYFSYVYSQLQWLSFYFGSRSTGRPMAWLCHQALSKTREKWMKNTSTAPSPLAMIEKRNVLHCGWCFALSIGMISHILFKEERPMCYWWLWLKLSDDAYQYKYSDRNRSPWWANITCNILDWLYYGEVLVKFSQAKLGKEFEDSVKLLWRKANWLCKGARSQKPPSAESVCSSI